MVTIQKEPPSASATKPIKVSDVKRREFVQPGKYYKTTFQVGPRRSYGKAIPSQTWTEKKDPNGGPSTWDPVYQVYDQILEANEVNGLIQESNDFQAANIRHKVEGDLNRMLVVLDVQEAKDYSPDVFNFNKVMAGSHIIQAMIDSAVKVALSNQTKASHSGGK